MTNKNVRNVQFHRTRFSSALEPGDGEPPKRHLKHNLNFPPQFTQWTIFNDGRIFPIYQFIGIGNIGEIDFNAY